MVAFYNDMNRTWPHALPIKHKNIVMELSYIIID